MNEAETRAELIDPALKAAGWGIVDSSKVLREYHITAGKIQVGGGRAKPLKADYILRAGFPETEIVLMVDTRGKNLPTSNTERIALW